MHSPLKCSYSQYVIVVASLVMAAPVEHSVVALPGLETNQPTNLLNRLALVRGLVSSINGRLEELLGRMRCETLTGGSPNCFDLVVFTMIRGSVEHEYWISKTTREQ
jgi:hypothetical protein